MMDADSQAAKGRRREGNLVVIVVSRVALGITAAALGVVVYQTLQLLP